MSLDTQRDNEMHDGTDIDLELTDQVGSDLEQPRKSAITQRASQTASKYLGDLQEARGIASAPPSFGDVVKALWRSPIVLADHWLLRFLVRLYSIPAMLAIGVLYWLIAALVHPVRGLLIATLLGGGIWLWFFS